MVAPRGIVANPFLSTSASAPPSRRITVLCTSQAILRHTHNYVVVIQGQCHHGQLMPFISLDTSIG